MVAQAFVQQAQEVAALGGTGLHQPFRPGGSRSTSRATAAPTGLWLKVKPWVNAPPPWIVSKTSPLAAAKPNGA